MFDQAHFAQTYRTHRLTTSQERHLFAWLRDRRREEEYDQVLQRIMGALTHDPDLIEDHSWPEIEDIGRNLGL